MRKVSCGVFLLLTLLTVSVAAKGKTFTYESPGDKVFAAVLSIVAEEWTLESTNKETGAVSFRAGTQDGSVLVVELAEGKTQITVNAKAARPGISWGAGIDAKRIQNKLIERLNKKLGVKGVEVKD